MQDDDNISVKTSTVVDGGDSRRVSISSSAADAGFQINESDGTLSRSLLTIVFITAVLALYLACDFLAHLKADMRSC